MWGSGGSNTVDYVGGAGAALMGTLILKQNETINVHFGGGNTGSNNTNTIDYVTIATTGNATDFGDLTVTRYYTGGCSSSTRGFSVVKEG